MLCSACADRRDAASRLVLLPTVCSTYYVQRSLKGVRSTEIEAQIDEALKTIIEELRALAENCYKMQAKVQKSKVFSSTKSIFLGLSTLGRD